MSLNDLARHGCVEHDASLGHKDALIGAEYAPTTYDAEQVEILLGASSDGQGLRLHDIAKARVKREDEYKTPLDAVHATIARGEMGIALALFGRWVPKRSSESPSSSSSSRSVTPSHSAESSSEGATPNTASGFSISIAALGTLSMRSSQSTLVETFSPVSPSSSAFPTTSKPALVISFDTLKNNLNSLLHTLSLSTKTVYTDTGAKEELELSLPLTTVRRWWMRGELPAGFRTASMVIMDDGSVDIDGNDEYGFLTQKERGRGASIGGRRAVTGLVEISKLGMAIGKAMTEIRKERT